MLEMKPLDPLNVISAQACEHLLYASSQAICPTFFHDLKLDQHGSRVSHVATDTSHDKPLKFPFWVIMKPNTREFWEWAVKVESQSGEVTLKDEIPITPKLVVLGEVYGHLQNLKIDLS
jgi:hypothetical protein